MSGDGLPFHVTELLLSSLADIILDRATPCDWERRLHFVMEAATGMEYLHSRVPPLIHRDFKTANVLVSASGTVKVADFGTSRALCDAWAKEQASAPISPDSSQPPMPSFWSRVSRGWRGSTLMEPLLSESPEVSDLDSVVDEAPQTAFELSSVSNTSCRELPDDVPVATVTMTGRIGTLAYMAPEVLRCQQCKFLFVDKIIQYAVLLFCFVVFFSFVFIFYSFFFCARRRPTH